MVHYECDRCHKRAPGKPAAVASGVAYYEPRFDPPTGWICAQTDKVTLIACTIACYKRLVELLPESDRGLLLRVLER